MTPVWTKPKPERGLYFFTISVGELANRRFAAFAKAQTGKKGLAIVAISPRMSWEEAMDHKAERGRRVREAREAQGLSRQQLAREASLAYDSLYRIEQGERDLQVDEAIALSERLHLPLRMLLYTKADLGGCGAREELATAARPRGRKTHRPFAWIPWMRPEIHRLWVWIIGFALCFAALIAFPAWPLRWHALGAFVCGFFILQLSSRLHFLDNKGAAG